MSINLVSDKRLDNIGAVEKFRALMVLAGWLIPALLTAIGLAGAVDLLVRGEEAFGTTDAVPWGILIAGYVLLAVTCSGLCLVSSLGHVFGIERFEIIGQRAIYLAVVVLISAFAVLAVELGHPFRLIYVLLSPNFHSGIWWMGTIYGIYLVGLMLELYFMLRHKEHPARLMGTITFILAIAATTNLGSVFGFVNAKPFWYGPYWPVYIIVTAIMSGTAVLIILAWFLQRQIESRRQRGFFQNGNMFKHRLKKLSATLSVLLAAEAGTVLVLTFWKVVTSLYGGVPGQQQAAMALLTGPLAPTFWVFEVGIGLLLPLALLLISRGKGEKFNLAAALSVILGMVFMRLHMVSSGQILYIDKTTGMASYAAYIPSLGETAVIVGAVGFILLAYKIGERYLPFKP